MIRYVHLKNYKSLVDLHVDFMKTKTKAKKFITIYGENGIGKSNLAASFYTLNETMNTRYSSKIRKELFENNDAEMDEKLSEINEFIEKHVKYNFKDTKAIIEDCKTIDSTGNLVLEFGFICKGKNGTYYLEMDEEGIVEERLEYILNKNQTYYFDINTKLVKINSNIFTDKAYYNEFNKLIEEYWGKYSFLSILSYEIDDKKHGYIKKKISNNLYNILTYLKTICTNVKAGDQTEFGIMNTAHKVMGKLEKGKIPIKQEEELIKTENFLNEFYTSLYSDIQKVYYEKEIKDNNIKYKLFFKKNLYGKLVDVDFSLESRGTRNLLELIPYLISACEGCVVVIDELDKGIHDLLITHVLMCIKKYLKGQLIITTHNTTLFESDIPKENIYVFNANRNAEKELIAITEFNGRIHKNINSRKQYLNGMYGGVPMASDIDFNELIDELK